MHCFEKLWKEGANIEILNLSKQKEEETIWCQNQIIILKKFFLKMYYPLKQKKRQILRNKPVYFGLLILELSKVLMYELWYHYIKPK